MTVVIQNVGIYREMCFSYLLFKKRLPQKKCHRQIVKLKIRYLFQEGSRKFHARIGLASMEVHLIAGRDVPSI